MNYTQDHIWEIALIAVSREQREGYLSSYLDCMGNEYVELASSVGGSDHDRPVTWELSS